MGAYVNFSYDFLGVDLERLETPTSLPKPQAGEAIDFNFELVRFMTGTGCVMSDSFHSFCTSPAGVSV